MVRRGSRQAGRWDQDRGVLRATDLKVPGRCSPFWISAWRRAWRDPQTAGRPVGWPVRRGLDEPEHTRFRRWFRDSGQYLAVSPWNCRCLLRVQIPPPRLEALGFQGLSFCFHGRERPESDRDGQGRSYFSSILLRQQPGGRRAIPAFAEDVQWLVRRWLHDQGER